ncbi:MAG: hypothetical protein AW07_03625 [Candidatus Accumulibacter sp. SK-11]|nr:MAG: hypothetical protein AW07_03625 [Candidatus Accumulibacter sp. SK-11]
MLARAAAAEVLARQQDLCPLVTRLIEHEVRVAWPLRAVLARFADIPIAPFVEQVGTKARTPDRLQELLRYDRVGVDVGAVERHHESVEASEFFHDNPLLPAI